MTDTPTHWTQFGSLYDLQDPRPYFRGVATADYRMPSVAADLIKRLAPLLTARPRPSGNGGLGLNAIDFACGYGAVGTCLRRNMTMADLCEYYSRDGDPEQDRDRLPPIDVSRRGLIGIAGIDIAGVALQYAITTGACDHVFATDVLSDPISGDLAEHILSADLILESGALGHLVAPAMSNLLAVGGRPWLVICPRPRIDVSAIADAIAPHGYVLHTIATKVRYRRPFSDGELQDEIQEAAAHGLPEADVLTNGYFRVDLRLALPREEIIEPVHSALADWDHDSI
ncbi:MAG: hypothetical protein RIM33_12570 [Alphaproteobacteria bacterium]